MRLFPNERRHFVSISCLPCSTSSFDACCTTVSSAPFLCSLPLVPKVVSLPHEMLNVKFDGQTLRLQLQGLKPRCETCCSNDQHCHHEAGCSATYLRDATASMTALKSASLYPAARACRAGSVHERTGQLCCTQSCWQNRAACRCIQHLQTAVAQPKWALPICNWLPTAFLPRLLQHLLVQLVGCCRQR